jgi:hopanoid-associated phosphorylase
VTVVAVCGLKREVELLARYAKATTPRDLTPTSDAAGIISIGIAGALAPDLRAGDVVIAERVVTANEAFETDGKWTARLAATLPQVRIGAILGRSAIADTTEVKLALRTSTTADVVDMESHLAARAARDSGLPFAALRVVSDRADHALPPAVLVAMMPDGGIALGRVLKSVAMNPAQIPGLIRTARESEKAFSALLGCVEVLGAGLGCPYLG